MDKDIQKLNIELQKRLGDFKKKGVPQERKGCEDGEK
jgi:hypothetical protein